MKNQSIQITFYHLGTILKLIHCKYKNVLFGNGSSGLCHVMGSSKEIFFYSTEKITKPKKKNGMCENLHLHLAMYIVLVNSVTMLDSEVLHYNGKKKKT